MQGRLYHVTSDSCKRFNLKDLPPGLQESEMGRELQKALEENKVRVAKWGRHNYFVVYPSGEGRGVIGVYEADLPPYHCDYWFKVIYRGHEANLDDGLKQYM